MITEEYKQQVSDCVKDQTKIIKTGMETCSWCGKEVPVEKMTASVTRGVICWDCDMELAGR